MYYDKVAWTLKKEYQTRQYKYQTVSVKERQGKEGHLIRKEVLGLLSDPKNFDWIIFNVQWLITPLLPLVNNNPLLEKE